MTIDVHNPVPDNFLRPHTTSSAETRTNIIIRLGLLIIAFVTHATVIRGFHKYTAVDHSAKLITPALTTYTVAASTNTRNNHA